MYYLGGEVYTLAEVRQLRPTGYILENMECNRQSRAIKCKFGNWQYFDIKDDILLDPVTRLEIEVK